MIPAASADSVREGDSPAARTPGVKDFSFQEKKLILQVGSGHYQFTAARP